MVILHTMQDGKYPKFYQKQWLKNVTAFPAKLRIKSKTTKNNVISSYKEDYFFDRKIREDRVLDVLDRFFQN